MNETRARVVVNALRNRGVDAQIARAGVYQFGVTIALGDGREAVWDADNTAGIEAQILRDGVLVGFVPVIEGSADFDSDQVIDAICRADYNQPVGTLRSTPLPAAPALPGSDGIFRRLIGGFR